jgi:hypothetical protein
MSRLNSAAATFGIIILMLGFRAEANEYVDKVAPILIEQCQMCHREGGIAPWAMSNYQVVQAFAPAIKEAIVSRRMPPGQINPKYRDTIINHRTLSDDEMKTLVDWVDAGAPVEGVIDPLTQTVYPDSEWVHGEPDMIVEVPPQEIPAGPSMIPYRYVGVDLGLTEDKWLRGSEFLPSEPTVMHHMLNSVAVPGESKW